VSDEGNQNSNPPAEGSAQAASEPSFSAADVARILEQDRNERTAAPAGNDDPVAKFRATATAAKLYGAPKSEAKPQPSSELSELLQIAKAQLAMNLAAMRPPAPPVPPKMMSVSEKLQTDDAAIWLRRGNPNEWTSDDRAQLVAQHAAQLAKEGFKGWIDREAEARAAREIAQAAMRALRNIRIDPRGLGGMDLNTLVRK